MKKLLAAIIVLALAGCTGVGNQASSEQINIGILQIVDHPALDAARNGFINGLAEEGWVEGEDVVFHPFSAQGDISNANAMAQRIVDMQVDMILGIATPTSQTLANTTETIPIVITAVTDPLRAGLIESFERPGTNVTGTSDLTPVTQQFQLLMRLLPDAQTVGIMYNAGEVNSAIQADMAREAAVALGLDYIAGVAPSTADVASVIESIIDRVDVIYIPTCNTMATAYTTINDCRRTRHSCYSRGRRCYTSGCACYRRYQLLSARPSNCCNGCPNFTR